MKKVRIVSLDDAESKPFIGNILIYHHIYD